MLRRFPKTLRWRQALPPLFLFGILMLLLLSPFWNLARILFGIIACFYICVLVIGAIPEAHKQHDPALLIGVPLAIMTMHFSWGAGFWWSILKGAAN